MVIPRGKGQDELILTHKSNLWGLLVFDEIQHMSLYNAKGFAKEFEISCMVAIGFLATPICDLQHFCAVLSFCSHPLAMIKDAEEPQKILTSPTKSNLLYAAWKQEVMGPADKHDTVLKKGQGLQLMLKQLLSSLAACIFPKVVIPKKEATGKHHQLMQKVLPLLEALVNFAKYYKDVQTCHQQSAGKA